MYSIINNIYSTLFPSCSVLPQQTRCLHSMATGHHGPPGVTVLCHVESASSLGTGSVPEHTALAAACHVKAPTERIKHVSEHHATVSVSYVNLVALY